MLTSVLILYVIGAIVGFIALQFIIESAADRLVLLPSTKSLIYIVTYIIIGFGFDLFMFVWLLIIIYIFAYFMSIKLENRITPELLVRLYENGFNSKGNLAECLNIQSSNDLDMIIANMSATNQIPPEVKFDSGGTITKRYDGVEWSEDFCNKKGKK